MAITAVGMAKTDLLVNETNEFRRGQHLLFAVLSLLAISADSLAGWRTLEILGASWPWDGADVLLERMIPLVVVAVLAWLAFAAVDTRADVKMVSRTCWNIGWEPWAVFVGLMATYVVAPHVVPHDAITRVAQTYYSFFYDEYTGVAWGWLIAASVAGALMEELVFRGLLQRALEGYVRGGYALIVQAIVFHLIHVYVYGVSAAGGMHIIAGIMYGMAFMRTRCLLAPLILHAGGNLIHAAVFVTALE